LNPRYTAFLLTGGGPNWEFMAFISRAKQFASSHGLGVIADRVIDHDMFTLACFWLAHLELAQ